MNPISNFTGFIQMLLTDKKSHSAAHQSREDPHSLHRFLFILSPKKPQKQRSTPPRQSTDAKSGDFEKVFHYFDMDGDGKISPTELCNCMKTVGEELSAEDAEAVVESTDSDGDGLLGFDDFMKLVEVEGEEEKGMNLREAFRVFEMEGEGCITPKSLRWALGRLGEKKTIEDCATMVHRFDLNGDGVISFEEFCNMML